LFYPILIIIILKLFILLLFMLVTVVCCSILFNSIKIFHLGNDYYLFKALHPAIVSRLHVSFSCNRTFVVRSLTQVVSLFDVLHQCLFTWEVYFMVELNYNNYLIGKTDSKFLSHFTLINLAQTRNGEMREYMFKVNPEYLSINTQAEFFAKYLCSTSVFENSFVTSSRRPSDVIEIVRKAYIYSYCKSIVYAYGCVNKDRNYSMGPQNNLVFHGHKMMHDIIVKGRIEYYLPPANNLSVQLDAAVDSIATLQTWAEWPSFYNSTTNNFFDTQCESVLGWLQRKGQNFVCVGEIGVSVTSDVFDVARLPLGNLVYSENMLVLKYVEDRSFPSDKKSYYWGKACMIAVTNAPFIDIDDSVYDTVLVSSYDSKGINYEVESITGYCPLNRVTTPIDIIINGAGGGSPDLRGPGRTPVNPLNGQPNNGRRGNNNNPRPRQPNGGGNGGQNNNIVNQAKLTFNKAKRYSQSAINALRVVDNVLTNDGVNTAAAVISKLTGKNVNPARFRNRVGQRIGDIFNDYGVPYNHPQFETILDEYGSIVNGQNDLGYRVETVSTQKLIEAKNV
jgi:hypothetical protein